MAAVRKKEQALWLEDSPAMRKIRKGWINNVSSSEFVCRANWRGGGPDEGCDDTTAEHRNWWDSNWLQKSVSVELLYPPKKCMEVAKSVMENRLEEFKDSNEGKDYGHLTMHCSVRQVGEFREYKGDVLMPCTLETNLKVWDFPVELYDNLCRDLMDHGVGFSNARHILPDPYIGGVIHHSFDTVIVNPPIRDTAGLDEFFRDNQRYGLLYPKSKGTLRVYKDDDPKAMDGFRESDMLDHARRYRWQDLPLNGHDLTEEIPDLTECSRETREHMKTVFLCHKMGILGRYPRELDSGEHIVEYGRIAIPISKGGKGLLPLYRSILKGCHENNPGFALGPNGKLDSKLLRFDHRTRIGFMDGSIIRATCEEQKNKASVRHRMLHHFAKIKPPKELSR